MWFLACGIVNECLLCDEPLQHYVCATIIQELRYIYLRMKMVMYVAAAQRVAVRSLAGMYVGLRESDVLDWAAIDERSFADMSDILTYPIKGYIF